MLKHGELFTYNKQQAILLLDKIILSLDDKEDNEFVFTTVQDNNIDRPLYFVVSNANYAKFKKEYPKATLFGFWHSLFLNDKIDLTLENHYLVTDGPTYHLRFKEGELSTAFDISQREEIESNIDTNLSKFEALISQADKSKKQRLQSKIKLAISALSAVIVISVFYLTNIQKESRALMLVQEISTIKQEIAIQEDRIIKLKKAVYKPNPMAKNNLKSLLFLRFKNIDLIGDIDSLNGAVKIKSSSDVSLLAEFTAQYPQYKFKRHAEALPTLEFSHE